MDHSNAPGGVSPPGLRDSLGLVRDKRCAVFVGRMPRRTELSHVLSVFSSAGLVPRQIIPSRETYLFVELADEASAAAACSRLNGTQLGGSPLVVLPAVSLTKLFVGNIHRQVDASTVHEAIASVEEGLVSVELYEEVSGTAHTHSVGNGHGKRGKPMSDPSSGLQHRGFCFAEFGDHDAAHRALRSLTDPAFTKIPLGIPLAAIAPHAAHSPATAAPSSSAAAPISGRGRAGSAAGGLGDASVGAAAAGSGSGLKVDWAEPLYVVSEDVMRNVRILYVSNLPPLLEGAQSDGATEALLLRMFERYGPVERVKRMRNFAFVHFKARDHAAAALAGLHDAVLAGHAIKVQWSKPPPSKSGAPAPFGTPPAADLGAGAVSVGRGAFTLQQHASQPQQLFSSGGSETLDGGYVGRGSHSPGPGSNGGSGGGGGYWGGSSSNGRGRGYQPSHRPQAQQQQQQLTRSGAASAQTHGGATGWYQQHAAPHGYGPGSYADGPSNGMYGAPHSEPGLGHADGGPRIAPSSYSSSSAYQPHVQAPFNHQQQQQQVQPPQHPASPTPSPFLSTDGSAAAGQHAHNTHAHAQPLSHGGSQAHVTAVPARPNSASPPPALGPDWHALPAPEDLPAAPRWYSFSDTTPFAHSRIPASTSSSSSSSSSSYAAAAASGIGTQSSAAGVQSRLLPAPIGSGRTVWSTSMEGPGPGWAGRSSSSAGVALDRAHPSGGGVAHAQRSSSATTTTTAIVDAAGASGGPGDTAAAAAPAPARVAFLPAGTAPDGLPGLAVSAAAALLAAPPAAPLRLRSAAEGVGASESGPSDALRSSGSGSGSGDFSLDLSALRLRHRAATVAVMPTFNFARMRQAAASQPATDSNDAGSGSTGAAAGAAGAGVGGGGGALSPVLEGSTAPSPFGNPLHAHAPSPAHSSAPPHVPLPPPAAASSHVSAIGSSAGSAAGSSSSSSSGGSPATLLVTATRVMRLPAAAPASALDGHAASGASSSASLQPAPSQGEEASTLHHSSSGGSAGSGRYLKKSHQQGGGRLLPVSPVSVTGATEGSGYTAHHHHEGRGGSRGGGAGSSGSSYGRGRGRGGHASHPGPPHGHHGQEAHHGRPYAGPHQYPQQEPGGSSSSSGMYGSYSGSSTPRTPRGDTGNYYGPGQHAHLGGRRSRGEGRDDGTFFQGSAAGPFPPGPQQPAFPYPYPFLPGQGTFSLYNDPASNAAAAVAATAAAMFFTSQMGGNPYALPYALQQQPSLLGQSAFGVGPQGQGFTPSGTGYAGTAGGDPLQQMQAAAHQLQGAGGYGSVQAPALVTSRSGTPTALVASAAAPDAPAPGAMAAVSAALPPVVSAAGFAMGPAGPSPGPLPQASAAGAVPLSDPHGSHIGVGIPLALLLGGQAVAEAPSSAL